jgi:hypothetical protein
MLRSRVPQHHGIDRIVHDIETGHFERTLSALTAGALVTAAEISSSMTAPASATR